MEACGGAGFGSESLEDGLSGKPNLWGGVLKGAKWAS